VFIHSDSVAALGAILAVVLITYRGRNGRQYVAVVAIDSVLAYALLN
jgi:hypothetical protein